MEYRINKRTQARISVLGFGTSYIAQASEKDAVEAIRRAYEGGVNYYDFPLIRDMITKKEIMPTAQWRSVPLYTTAAKRKESVSR